MPLDATVEEVSKVFSKAGFILPDADGNPKVKLYTDKDTGIRNGDGLVVYLKEESVSLATNLFDDTPFRLGDQDNMKVTKAEWSHKETAENGKAQDAPDERGRKKSDGRAQKMQKRAEKLLQCVSDSTAYFTNRLIEPTICSVSTEKRLITIPRTMSESRPSWPFKLPLLGLRR